MKGVCIIIVERVGKQFSKNLKRRHPMIPQTLTDRAILQINTRQITVGSPLPKGCLFMF